LLKATLMNTETIQSSDREAADHAMERYAAGDDRAFADVHAYLQPRLHAYLLRRCRNRAYAEDMLQLTFLRLHRARATFAPGSRVVPWAFAIATRLLVDAARAARRSPDEVICAFDAPAHGVSAEDRVRVRELYELYQQELARLPVPQRAAFRLVGQEGLSLAHAAERLGVSVTAIKLRLHRARQALLLVLV
jgi:RNA polymerase sigma-70 factor, ECF subfamily